MVYSNYTVRLISTISKLSSVQKYLIHYSELTDCEIHRIRLSKSKDGTYVLFVKLATTGSREAVEIFLKDRLSKASYPYLNGIYYCLSFDGYSTTKREIVIKDPDNRFFKTVFVEYYTHVAESDSYLSYVSGLEDNYDPLKLDEDKYNMIKAFQKKNLVRFQKEFLYTDLYYLENDMTRRINDMEFFSIENPPCSISELDVSLFDV